MMRRYVPLLFVVLVFVSRPAPAQISKKPNIMIILVDDLGWGDLGYQGGISMTPNLNALAADGIQLSRFYVAPVCSPTRAGLLTGRYPDRFGLRDTVIPPWSQFGVDTTEAFLPQFLAREGYADRAIFGKWHLGHAGLRYHPLNRGFTHFYGHLNGAIDYFTHEREGELDWHNDFEPSHDSGYSTDIITDDVIRCIRKYQRTSPFFMYVAFNAPHGPFQAKGEDLARYGYDPTRPPFGNSEGKSKEGTMGRGNSIAQTYSAMVTNLDFNIGRILKALEENHLEENTLLLFFSDNGPSPAVAGANAGDLRGTKFTEWEGGVRVPAIVRWPAGLQGKRVVDQVTGYIDVLPTLLEIVGNNVGSRKPLDGISVARVLSGEVPHIDREFYLGHGALVTSKWKFIAASGLNPKMKVDKDHLFNISEDPSETKNVAHLYPDVAEEMRSRVARYDSIRSPVSVPPYEQGRKGFVAPEEWNIQQW